MADSPDDMAQEIERLRAENEALKSKSSRDLRLQVSQKGAVSLYGIRRFPVTFYMEEWELILGKSDDIFSFIRELEHELKKKGS